MKYLKLTGMIIISITLCSCAHQYTGDTIAEPYGFLYGIWHGLIFWLSLIGTIFSDDISIIGKPNDGFLYHFGFAIGLISSFAIRIRPWLESREAINILQQQMQLTWRATGKHQNSRSNLKNPKYINQLLDEFIIEQL